MKKGFTLIELLAVIVILAIIALIAIPRITKVVDEAKKGAAEASALGYIDAVEKQIMINATSKKFSEINDGTYPVPLDSIYGVTVKGKTPADGSEIVIEKGRVKTYHLIIDGYTIISNGTTKRTVKGIIELCHAYEMNEVIYENGTPNSYTFTPKCTGNYKLEVWGAQGGTYHSTCTGGYGGYAVGSISLAKNTDLYITVGGQVRSGNGYNGGGLGQAGIGGSATHIGLDTGALSTFKDKQDRLLIVAGGGGGQGGVEVEYYWSRNVITRETYSGVGCGGAGGGIVGGNGDYINGNVGKGGSQTTGANFGVGGSGGSERIVSGNALSEHTETYYYGGAGGGGFYGGFNGTRNGGGGGSGYIANPKLTDKKMVMYATDNSYISNDENTKTEITTNVSATAESDKPKSGNGAVKITYIG